MAVDPNNPATASPRFGGGASGVGVGLSDGTGDAVGSSVPRAGVGAADALAAGVGVSVSCGVGDGLGDTIGDGVGVSQNGKHGVGGVVVVGDGVGDGDGVGSCAAAAAGQSTNAKPTNTIAARALHLDNEVRLRGSNTGEAVDALENDIGEMAVIGELTEREDVGLSPAGMRLLDTVE